jgi:hypothetical protein
MNHDEKMERARQLVADEVRTRPRGLWYLSYADEHGFRGAVYLEAHGPASAAIRSNIENLSPGGEVFIGGPVPSDCIPDRKFWNRLLTRDEVIAANPNDVCGTLAEFEEMKRRESK